MTDSPSPARRLAGAWAAVSGLSMTGHLAGGAAMPSPVAVALVAILGLTVAALLTRGDAPVRTTTAVWVLGAFQGVAHLILHHVTGTAAVTTAAAHAAHMTHATHGTTAVSAASAASAASAVSTLSAGPTSGLGVHGVSPLMATSHLLATVVLAWLLCGHAGTSVRVVLDRLLGVLLAGPTPARPPAWTPVIGHPMARVSQEIRAGLSLRGPPAATLR